MSFFTPQHDQMDCGPACICMAAKYHGKKYSLEYLRKNAFITREGVSLLGINEASKKIGFETLSAKLTTEQLVENKTNLPCILHWNQNHFVVLYKISKTLFSKQPIFHIADPAHGKIKLNQEKFKKSWLSDSNKGVALFLNPTESFYKKQPPIEKKLTIKYLVNYLKTYKTKLAYMFLLLLLGSGLTLIFPFLTEALIDRGVNAKNLNLIFIILLAQLGVFLDSITIEIIRNWLMLYVGTHLSITII